MLLVTLPVLEERQFNCHVSVPEVDRELIKLIPELPVSLIPEIERW